MNKATNDNAAILVRLYERGAKPVLITSKSLGLKGLGGLPSYENMDGVPIHRLYRDFREMVLFPRKHLAKVLQIAKSLGPDLILCSEQGNMRLALIIQKYFNKPIVLYVEDAGRIFSGEVDNDLKKRVFLNFVGIPAGAQTFWRWLCEKAAVLISSHPRDQRILNFLSNGKPMFHLPWPSYVPDDFKSSIFRDKTQGIYVGSLMPFKNTQEFQWTLPLILEKTKVKKFVVIGPGPHAALIKKLKEKYGNRIGYIPQVSRNEALRIISSSFFAYTPVRRGGWGFICDCWSMKTPIVMTHNDDCYVSDRVNVLLSKSEADLVENINQLYDNAELYNKLQGNGYEEYTKHTAEVIGDKLYDILKTAL
jgi:glycosyltransferase involved in cell wall biosynthesis